MQQIIVTIVPFVLLRIKSWGSIGFFFILKVDKKVCLNYMSAVYETSEMAMVFRLCLSVPGHYREDGLLDVMDI